MIHITHKDPEGHNRSIHITRDLYAATLKTLVETGWMTSTRGKND